MSRQVYTARAAIASGAALSGAIEKGNGELVAIGMPAAWTAAALTVQASDDGEAWLDVVAADGTEYSLTVDAGRYVIVPVDDLAGARWVRLRSGTAETPVNQAAARDLALFLRE